MSLEAKITVDFSENGVRSFGSAGRLEGLTTNQAIQFSNELKDLISRFKTGYQTTVTVKSGFITTIQGDDFAIHFPDMELAKGRLTFIAMKSLYRSDSLLLDEVSLKAKWTFDFTENEKSGIVTINSRK